MHRTTEHQATFKSGRPEGFWFRQKTCDTEVYTQPEYILPARTIYI